MREKKNTTKTFKEIFSSFMTPAGAYTSLTHLVSSLIFYNPVSFKQEFMKVSRTWQISVMALFLLTFLSREMSSFFKDTVDPQNSTCYYANAKKKESCVSVQFPSQWKERLNGLNTEVRNLVKCGIPVIIVTELFLQPISKCIRNGLSWHFTGKSITSVKKIFSYFTSYIF